MRLECGIGMVGMKDCRGRATAIRRFVLVASRFQSTIREKKQKQKRKAKKKSKKKINLMYIGYSMELASIGDPLPSLLRLPIFLF